MMVGLVAMNSETTCKICSQYIDLTEIKCSNENQIGKEFSLRYISTKTSVLLFSCKNLIF